MTVIHRLTDIWAVVLGILLGAYATAPTPDWAHTLLIVWAIGAVALITAALSIHAERRRPTL